MEIKCLLRPTANEQILRDKFTKRKNSGAPQKYQPHIMNNQELGNNVLHKGEDKQCPK